MCQPHLYPFFTIYLSDLWHHCPHRPMNRAKPYQLFFQGIKSDHKGADLVWDQDVIVFNLHPDGFYISVPVCLLVSILHTSGARQTLFQTFITFWDSESFRKYQRFDPLMVESTTALIKELFSVSFVDFLPLKKEKLISRITSCYIEHNEDVFRDQLGLRIKRHHEGEQMLSTPAD